MLKKIKQTTKKHAKSPSRQRVECQPLASTSSNAYNKTDMLKSIYNILFFNILLDAKLKIKGPSRVLFTIYK